MTRRSRGDICASLALVDEKLIRLQQKDDKFQVMQSHLISCLSALDTERQSLEVERNELEAERRALEAEKGPINWLPTELLMAIFIAAAELDLSISSGRPELNISHTCAKWRSTALATPRLWARVLLHGFQNPGRRLGKVYLERSQQAPLEIEYRSLPKTMVSPECSQISSLLTNTKCHFIRLETLSLYTASATALIYLLPYLNGHSQRMPRLRSLTLGITTANPTFQEAGAFLDRENNTIDMLNARGSPEDAAESTSRLLHLKLVQVPLLGLPISLIANLRSLEVSYAPRKRNFSPRNYYLFRMSALCAFLSLTPLLEELILNDTIPYFDVALSSQNTAVGGAGAQITRQAVRVDYLKSIDWTYPSASDIPRLLSLINAPELEKLDLCVEGAAPHPYPSVPSPADDVANFPALRDLALQCDGGDATTSALRKLLVPALKKVEFASFDTAAPDAHPVLPTFPRLESVFRDPRLLNLTHLTLSRYNVSSEPGRVEALLGYMPVLTSLTLEACSGLRSLLGGLQETLGGASDGAAVGARSRRGVKVCPRLDTLSFWDCQDVDCASLRGAVLARNRCPPECGAGDTTTCTPCAAPIPNGETELVTRALPGEIVGGGQTTKEVLPRKIKPLRKLRRPAPELGQAANAGGEATSTVASTVIETQEAFQPACISFVRVKNCSLMGKDEVLALRDLGVVDVIWVGSG
ncbi:hypothetical protein HYPSUDRAFT_46117 [Hypholoma sublateritium FD-334 SS-4]|uniref:Uncharacterized protein n=1 Tax=Hypholoma sublateritium (strain FD-334 SS-4) TaxID=945553 RepID=A0A0D2NF94_HYPSF|nr:hypothetical protein HYPSUDRAFT_46117 [Hypholoma sublateritium FD-334 SS-4]